MYGEVFLHRKERLPSMYRDSEWTVLRLQHLHSSPTSLSFFLLTTTIDSLSHLRAETAVWSSYLGQSSACATYAEIAFFSPTARTSILEVRLGADATVR